MATDNAAPILAFTDGGFKEKPLRAPGCGVYSPDKRIGDQSLKLPVYCLESNGVPCEPSNTAELWGIVWTMRELNIQGLNCVPVWIYSDSEYALLGIAGHNNRRANPTLWRELEYYLLRRKAETR